MKKRFLLLIILFIAIVVYIYTERAVLFVYTNPYIETSGFQHIAKAVKYLDKTLKVVRSDAKAAGQNFEYLYINAYGSGFLKNNPIPNDLDTAIGIYLGEYEYDGKNGQDIARSLIAKITAFQYSFSNYIDSPEDKEAYIGDNPLLLLSKFARVKEKNIEGIASALEEIVRGGDNYVAYTRTVDYEEDGMEKEISLPYVMKSNEVLLRNYVMLHVLSDLVSYNASMPKYQREISIIPEFYFDLKSEDNVTTVEIVPEIALGKKVQLARNFFASSVYINNSSAKFISTRPYLVEDEKYFSYRMLTFKTYLQDVFNAGITDDKPVKQLKRIMQTADMISPMIGDKIYNEISGFVNDNLSNREIQLLNEYINACDMLARSTKTYKLYSTFKRNGELDTFLNTISDINAELEQRGKLDKNTIKVLKDFRQNELERLAGFEDEEKLIDYKMNVFYDKYDKVLAVINKSLVSQVQHKEKIAQYIQMFNKIYQDAGYHEITCYLLDKNTIGILADDYTRTIKDLRKFAKDNNIAEITVKLIDKAPAGSLGYKLWASSERNEVFEQLYNSMIEDKKNFKVKRKLIIF